MHNKELKKNYTTDPLWGESRRLMGSMQKRSINAETNFQ